MITNFLIDSRFGGPHTILKHLYSNTNYQNKTIYLDKNYMNFKFSNLKKFNNFFYIFDIFYNFLKLYMKKKTFNKSNVFFVFSIVNIIPILLGISLKKKLFGIL